MSIRKRLIAALLAVCLTAALGASAFAAGPGLNNFRKKNTYTPDRFSDINSTHWAYDNVAMAYELGLIQGESESRFGTDGSLTIAATIALAARIHSIYNTGGESFVQGSPWYQCYVDYALENSLISTAFKNYDQPVDRGTFAKILARALPASELKEINTVEKGAIPDVDLLYSDYADEVYLLYRSGIVTGKDSYGSFYPGSGILRSEASALVTRMVVPALRKSITLTRGGIIQAVIDSEATWFRKKESGTVLSYYFKDFTLDGVPEFVVTVSGGTGLFTHYYVYQYQNGKMVQILTEWAENGGPDSLDLYRSKADGSVFYVGMDTVRGGRGVYSDLWYKYDGSTVTFLFGSDTSGNTTKYYNGSRQQITKAAYDRLQSSYMAGLEKLGTPKGQSLDSWNRGVSTEVKYQRLALLLSSVG